MPLFGGGVVTVIASQPGNSNYNAAATVQQAFTISKIPQTITFGALSQQKKHILKLQISQPVHLFLLSCGLVSSSDSS
jgi:hypothetical protein